MRSFALVACVLCWRAVGAQLSLAFSAVALAGRTQSRRPSRFHAIRRVSSQLSKSLLPAAPWMLRRVQLQTSYVRLRTVQRTVQQLRGSDRLHSLSGRTYILAIMHRIWFNCCWTVACAAHAYAPVDCEPWCSCSPIWRQILGKIIGQANKLKKSGSIKCFLNTMFFQSYR